AVAMAAVPGMRRQGTLARPGRPRGRVQSLLLSAFLFALLAPLALPSFAAPSSRGNSASSSEEIAKESASEADYEASFRSRLREVRSAPKETAPEAKKRQKPKSSAADPPSWAFWEDRAGSPELGGNFLSKVEWKQLLAGFAFLAFVTVAVWVVKGRGY
ncbi:unnamed protein product, partial [Polarella glacialis]